MHYSGDGESIHGMVTAVRTERRQEMISLNGYNYVFDKFSADRSRKFWRCRYKGTCKARLHTAADNNNVVWWKCGHNHKSCLEIWIWGDLQWFFLEGYLVSVTFLKWYLQNLLFFSKRILLGLESFIFKIFNSCIVHLFVQLIEEHVGQ